MELTNVEFREGLLEQVPVEDGWADVVISNGVINLCADKATVFAEAYRILRPGGSLQFADIANGKPLPEAAVCEIDLWTGCIAGGLPVDDWCAAITGAGFTDVSVGLAVDAFGGSGGESNARAYDVAAHVFLATKPRHERDGGWPRQDERGMTTRTGLPVPIVSIVDEGLGHSSYVVGLGDGTALVVDPARFPDRQRRAAAERGWRIAWTADTHSHADYISGSPELAADGADFLASAGARLEVDAPPRRRRARPSTSPPGSTLRAIATPGHTPDHLAYLLLVDGESGGPVLGRVADGRRARPHRPARRRAPRGARPGDVPRAAMRRSSRCPTTSPSTRRMAPGRSARHLRARARTTTIGTERATNPLLSIDDEDRFVATLLDGLGSFPTYFRQLPEINRRGPRLYPELPALARLDLDTVRRHVEDGAGVRRRPAHRRVRGRACAGLAVGRAPERVRQLVRLARPHRSSRRVHPRPGHGPGRSGPAVPRRRPRRCCSASSTAGSPPGRRPVSPSSRSRWSPPTT